MKNLHSSKMVKTKRLYNSRGWEQSSSSTSSVSSLLGDLNKLRQILPLPMRSSVSPQSSSLPSSKPQTPQKLLIIQALILLLAILLIPLADAVKDSTESSVGSESSSSRSVKLNETTTSMTHTESTQFQRVTITPSYSSTIVKTGGGSKSGNLTSSVNSSRINKNINYHNNKDNQNNSHTTPVRRNYSFSFSTSSSSSASASPVNKDSTTNNNNIYIHPRYRNLNKNKKMYRVNNNNYNSRVTPMKPPRRRPQLHQFFTRPRQSLFSADFQPQFSNNNNMLHYNHPNPPFNQNQHSFMDFTSTIKPTMHPLRVLQTEISPPVKVSVVLPQEKNATIFLSMGSPVPVPVPVNPQIVNSTRENVTVTMSMSSGIPNLENHRMNENETISTNLITDMIANNKNNATAESIFNSYENHLSDEIKAQLELINQRIPPQTTTASSKPPTPVAPKSSQIETTSSHNELLIGVNKVEGAVEGRSAGENMEQIVRTPVMAEVTSALRTKGNSTSSHSEEMREYKQLKTSSMNFFDQFGDNIAEEDNQYEVTELVNQYPAQYDTQDPGRDHQYKENPSHSPALLDQQNHNQNLDSDYQNQNQQSQQQPSQILPPIDSPPLHQNLNSNHYDQYFNNFYKTEKNRPKLNSYYDQNYYADASNQYSQQQQHPMNNHYQFEHQKHQAHKENHYYANSDKGDFNGNPNEEVDHANPNPGYGTAHGPSQHPQSSSYSNHHQSSPYGQSGGSHYHNSHHPPPQPYRGEHDIETSDAGNIMDRFEVFYTEHKILTWGAVFIAAGLALVCVVAYLYVNHPPTEVVTARSLINEYLRDPGLLKFLSNLIEPENGSRSRRRNKKKLNQHPMNFQSLLSQEAKEL